MTSAGRASRSHHDSHRWVQKYARELDKQTRWYDRYLTGRPVPGGWMRPISGSAAGGATSIGRSPPVARPWTFTSLKRNVAAAKRFLTKALRSNASAEYPRAINTDKAPSLARTIAELKSEGICPPTVEYRQVKYLNNILEGDHGRLKRILGPKGAFKNRTSAYRTLKGMEAMHSLRKGQGAMFAYGQPNPNALVVSRVFATA